MMTSDSDTNRKAEVTINVGRDFSKFPGGRFKKKAKRSGEEFRETLLIPALKNFDLVKVDLDDAISYGSSFLDEAFAGLVRIGVLSKSDFPKRVEIRTKNPLWRKEIEFFVETSEEETTQSDKNP